MQRDLEREGFSERSLLIRHACHHCLLLAAASLRHMPAINHWLIVPRTNATSSFLDFSPEYSSGSPGCPSRTRNTVGNDRTWNASA
mmetsp:Transcript_35803/g.73585  ORF Transcript_35803/g.73585 Transcript_35803/m.73585 type:complete len:86 (+) Transcript_35803:154-411(+)